MSGRRKWRRRMPEQWSLDRADAIIASLHMNGNLRGLDGNNLFPIRDAIAIELEAIAEWCRLMLIESAGKYRRSARAARNDATRLQCANFACELSAHADMIHQKFPASLEGITGLRWQDGGCVKDTKP